MEYIIGNKIERILLANICVIKNSFMDEKFAEKVYQILEIKLQRLIKPKQIQEFDSRAAKYVSYAIYLILIIDNYIESFAHLLIIKLGHYFMIFGQL